MCVTAFTVLLALKVSSSSKYHSLLNHYHHHHTSLLLSPPCHHHLLDHHHNHTSRYHQRHAVQSQHSQLPQLDGLMDLSYWRVCAPLFLLDGMALLTGWCAVFPATDVFVFVYFALVKAVACSYVENGYMSGWFGWLVLPWLWCFSVVFVGEVVYYVNRQHDNLVHDNYNTRTYKKRQ